MPIFKAGMHDIILCMRMRFSRVWIKSSRAVDDILPTADEIQLSCG
jgi:hypothetical protein